MAVECKNLDPSAPAVICGRPRTEEEAYYTYIESSMGDGGTVFPDFRKVRGGQFYKAGEFVGKSIVRLRENRGNLEAISDADIYEKWSQALASSIELAEVAAAQARLGHTHCCALFLPIVVVPEGTLWQVSYDGTGNISEDPEQVSHCEFFVERRFRIHSKEFVLTHIHLATLKGFRELLSLFWKHTSYWTWLFHNPASELL
jgi:hypothetical protein